MKVLCISTNFTALAHTFITSQVAQLRGLGLGAELLSPGTHSVVPQRALNLLPFEICDLTKVAGHNDHEFSFGIRQSIHSTFSDVIARASRSMDPLAVDRAESEIGCLGTLAGALATGAA